MLSSAQSTMGTQRKNTAGKESQAVLTLEPHSFERTSFLT